VPSITALRHPGLDAPSGIIAAFGEVWFTNIGADNVGRVRDGRIEVFDTPPGSGIRFPANIFPGADGRVWFTSLGSDALAAMDPAAMDPSSTLTVYPLPENSRPVALKSGSDGRLWFSLRGTDSIGSIDPLAADPSASLSVLTGPEVAGPAALFVAADASVWWVNSGSGTIGGHHPATGAMTIVDSPPCSPRAWAQTPDGMLWLTTREPAGLLSFDPRDPADTVRHVSDPVLVEPDGVCTAVDGSLWLVDSATDSVVRYAPGGDWQRFGAAPDVAGPFDIKPGPDPTVLWFTNKTGNSIGQVSADL